MMQMSSLTSIKKDVRSSIMMRMGTLKLTIKVSIHSINRKVIYTNLAMDVTSVQVLSVSTPRRMFPTTAAITTSSSSQSSSNLVDLCAGEPTVPAYEPILIIFKCDLIF